MNIRTRRWEPNETPETWWDRMNEAWRDLREALRAIPRLSIYERTFTGPVASLTAEFKDASRPTGVLLIDIMDTATGETVAVTWSWSWSSSTLTTTSFSGIAAGTYRVRLLMIGGA